MSEANGRNLDALVGLPPVLDVCCGPRGMWFDKKDERAMFVDKREMDFGKVQNGQWLRIAPDRVADFTALPFPDDTFAHVVFDPPHVLGKEWWQGSILLKYGVLVGDWREMLRKGFAECFRVLRPEGTLIFKWCEVQFPLSDVLALTPEKPLYGHRGGKASKTHWVAFMKPNAEHHARPERSERT